MSRLFYFLTVAVVACGTSSERPIVAPMTPAPAPIAPSEEPPGDVRIDGNALGAPVRELLALEPFHAPCDVDAIDHKQRTLYFWAGGTCPQASPFPDATTVVVLTPRAKDVPHGDQPITLVAWSGPYFDKRTTLPVRVGDKRTDAAPALGKPVCARVPVATGTGPTPDLRGSFRGSTAPSRRPSRPRGFHRGRRSGPRLSPDPDQGCRQACVLDRRRAPDGHAPRRGP